MIPLLVLALAGAPSVGHQAQRGAAQNAASTGVSGLSFTSDFSVAQAEARRTKRPILSLRLLGDLDDELSCANSRFFKAFLYTDPAIQKLLRERFVLHWQSVRPVPKLTIDMGDGRVIQTTITGNSVHVVLDPDGRVLDAIPGMYTPASFARALQNAVAVAACAEESTPAACVTKHHATLRAGLDDEWRSAMKKLGKNEPPPAPLGVPLDDSALAISERAMAKAVIERPVLRQLQRAETEVSDPLMRQVARDTPRPFLPRGRMQASEEFLRTLEDNVALDSVVNEQRLHRSIHAWLEAEPLPPAQPFVERVYEFLFATPNTDPWLGLEDVMQGAPIRTFPEQAAAPARRPRVTGSR